VRLLGLAGAVLVLAACGGAKQAARPDLQQTLDRLVATHVAPGATAYVSGPRGPWVGAAGYANIAAKHRMQPDDRLRLESVSKLWTSVVLVQLAREKKLRLDEPLGKWWPELFTGDKATITIRQLLNHTSGLIDNNDLVQNSELWLSRTHDPKLRADLLATAAKLKKDPSATFDDTLEIRWAAALPLFTKPGTNWHYSNIGYKIAGHIAERASGESLDRLYHRIIIDPLHLKSAAYVPGGPIPGDHPVGYAMDGKKAIPATNVGAGALGAEGGIVADAQDEATFLQAAVRGDLVPTRDLLRTSAANLRYALGTGIGDTPCAGMVQTHNGGGASWASSVLVSLDGKRVAVLLLNGRGGRTDAAISPAAIDLFCKS
jgi:D-alanyl-D-alanine carboxypeptidase